MCLRKGTYCPSIIYAGLFCFRQQQFACETALWCKLVVSLPMTASWFSWHQETISLEFFQLHPLFPVFAVFGECSSAIVHACIGDLWSLASSLAFLWKRARVWIPKPGRIVRKRSRRHMKLAGLFVNRKLCWMLFRRDIAKLVCIVRMFVNECLSSSFFVSVLGFFFFCYAEAADMSWLAMKLDIHYLLNKDMVWSSEVIFPFAEIGQST